MGEGDGEKERGPDLGDFGVRLGTRLEEDAHERRVAVRDRGDQRRAVPTGPVRIGSVLEQGPHALDVSLPHRDVQGSFPQRAPALGVRPVLEEQAEQVRASLAGQEGDVAHFEEGALGASPALQKQSRGLRTLFGDRGREGREAEGAPEIRVRALIEEATDLLEPILFRGLDQAISRLAPLAPSPDGSPECGSEQRDAEDLSPLHLA